MKVGILTFHRAHNYGAVLQCYALQFFLKSLGCDVFVIDYKNERLLSCYKTWDKRRFLSKNPFTLFSKSYKEFFLIKHRRTRGEKFDYFINNFFKLCESSTSNILSLDLIIVGSDQVWNTHLTSGFDKMYWGDFEIRKGAKIISYAASIEEYWENSYNTKVRLLLNKFDAISVREPKTAEVLNRIVGKEVMVSEDPTLLLDPGIWIDLAQRPSLNCKYLLLYQVRNTKEGEIYARNVARKMGLKLICLSARIDQTNSKECIDASPIEFLGWFRYASYVICTSFHGTVFSIIYKVPFVSLKLSDGKDGRVESLLKQLDIPERLVNINTEKSLPDLNWNRVHSRLNHLRDSSIQYLLNFVK